MSFVSDFIGGITGKDSKKAANQAADAQVQATREAIDFQKETRDLVRKDLEPYRETGAKALDPLSQLVLDPNAQRDYVTKNPFFKSLADQSQNRITAMAGSRGKAFSGGTAEALQNSLLLLGTDLVNQGITQRSNLAGMGQAAAAGQAQASQNAGNTISSLITDQGDARASGIVGAANATTNASQNLVNTGLGVARLFQLCDAHVKEDIRKVGKLKNGLPLYAFRYKGDDKTQINVMAQDVEKIMPEAVIELAGVKHVNMEMLHGN